jgi:hypothetical protein
VQTFPSGHASQPKKTTLATSGKPSMKKPSLPAVGLALLTLSMGLSEYLVPTTTKPMGRWSFVFGPIWDQWGSTGVVLYWMCLGALCIVCDQLFRSKQ